MKTKRNLFVFVILVSLLLASCGGAEPALSEEQKLSTMVAATMAAMEAEVTLEPLPTDTNTVVEQIRPVVEPFAFGMMQSLIFFGVPLILPSEFPVSSDLPAIVPYAINGGQIFFEMSLDYGIECRGAGACTDRGSPAG